MPVDTGSPQKTWDEFWKPLFDSHPDEDIMEQVKKELHDYHWMMGQWSIALGELTGGKLSKPNYTADVMIAEVTDFFEKNDE